MTWKDILTVWSDSLWVSGCIWGLLGIVLLYLARRPAHTFLHVLSRTQARWLRTAARALDRVRENTQTVQQLLHEANARDLAERRVERTLRQFAHAIERDLQAFPQMQRRLMDMIEQIDRDYHDSVDTPPLPPQWLDAIDGVASSQAAGDPAVAGILDAMHGTLTRASHDALDEFRFVSRKRHGLLRRMLPQWRRAVRVLSLLDDNVDQLKRRANSIDAQIERYGRLSHEPPTMTLGVQARYWMRCLFAAAMLTLTGVLAVTEHTLLVAPLTTLLPPDSTAFAVPIATAEAWVVIGAQLVAGLLLLDLNRVTRVLPMLGLQSARVRAQLSTLLVVLWLAMVVFTGSFMLLGTSSNAITGRSFTEIGLMVLLALLLMPSGLALDILLGAGRSVVLSLAGSGMAVVALLFRALAWSARLGGRLLIAGYDVLIFLPLAVEMAIALRQQRNSAKRAVGVSGEEDEAEVVSSS